MTKQDTISSENNSKPQADGYYSDEELLMDDELDLSFLDESEE
ncbi:MAG TPA: hypothetical protein PLM16_00035 [Candidatus Woesebacteria bacterium]|nr:hypothetical protein [Candidatus Woesebacteria bacterium]